ncbi:MAG: RelA/SpoT domain-containing protein [Thermodesulfobacteriota bacterium]|nr:RelA/SpoT domain-containing protein [Thermodesulfobacteriota bacterium]
MREAYKEAYILRLQHEYHDLAPVAKRFAEMLVREIHKMTVRHDIPLAVPIEHRVKTWSSVEGKLKRNPFHGASLSELHDLIGIRLILLFKRDISRTCDLIDKTFQVQGRRDKGEDLSYEQFGYQSFHMIAKPPKTWLSVPSFEEFRHLEAEIQVRTLAQHMWAAASHKLQYKQEDAVPPPIKRSIHRVSALLETVDLEFERVLGEREVSLSLGSGISNKVLTLFH